MRAPSIIAGLVLVASLSLCGCRFFAPSAETEAPAVETLIVQAPYIFEGRVLSTALSDVRPPSDRGTAIRVGVERTLKAPAHFPDYTGRAVTLVTQRSPGVDERYVFFAQGISFGRELVLRELRRIPSRDSATVKSVVDGVAELPSLLLRSHLRTADLVVTGTVERILAPPPDPARGFVSEHWPYWRAAQVRIEHVELGHHDSETLLVLFPSSEDVAWWQRPHFAVGDRGVWILHRAEGSKLVSATDSADFMPPASLPAVRDQIRVLRAQAEARR